MDDKKLEFIAMMLAPGFDTLRDLTTEAKRKRIEAAGEVYEMVKEACGGGKPAKRFKFSIPAGQWFRYEGE